MLGLFTSRATSLSAVSKSMEESKQQPPPTPLEESQPQTSSEMPSLPPSGTIAHPRFDREPSFGSTRTSTGTNTSSTSASTGSAIPDTARSTTSLFTSRTTKSIPRDLQRKLLAKSFLEVNGFMHVNEAKHSWGRTRYPLHVAVQQKKPAIVRALLRLGARPTCKTNRGLTPQALAMRLQSRWGGYQEVLDVFEELGGDHEIRLQRRMIPHTCLSSEQAIDETLRSLGVLSRGGPVASARLDYMAEQLEALQEQLVRAQPAGTRGLNPRIEQLEVATKVMDETYQALSSEMLQLREDLQKLRRLQASQDTQTSTLEASAPAPLEGRRMPPERSTRNSDIGRVKLMIDGFPRRSDGCAFDAERLHIPPSFRGKRPKD
ncbi:unnamed protein product [Symbiodinium sp. KB8]|nr:unnamed protein product [Symbiodinium sp. KB8]